MNLSENIAFDINDCDIIIENAQELKALLSYNDKSMAEANASIALADLSGIERSLSKLETLIINALPFSEKIKIAKDSTIGNGLHNVLAKDKDQDVRGIVAKNTSYPDTLNSLVSDKSMPVRITLTENPNVSENILSALIKDTKSPVRAAVAYRGYGLDILIDDMDEDVCNAVDEYLYKNNLTIEEYIANKDEWYAKALKDTALDEKIVSPSAIEQYATDKQKANKSASSDKER